MKPFAIFALVTIAFLLVVGCTERNLVETPYYPQAPDTDNTTSLFEMAKNSNYTKEWESQYPSYLGNCTENKSSHSNGGDYNDLVMHIECKGEPTAAPTPIPVPTPEYVMCSDYVKIVDKYRTVNANIIVTSDNETNYVSTYQYPNLTIGKFIRISERDRSETIIGGGYIMRMFDLRRAGDGNPNGFARYDHDIKTFDSVIPVTEAESGYREACKVVQK